jgi:hypothetical protein
MKDVSNALYHTVLVKIKCLRLICQLEGDVDWIGLAKDRNRWRALVNSVLNLRVP